VDMRLNDDWPLTLRMPRRFFEQKDDLERLTLKWPVVSC